ncbi:helix-turn-helix domain-containing protein [Actinomadura sp. J1-007]|nr:helix-turn-helix domain-containing protein [Actinomadura sp. J1-007]
MGMISSPVIVVTIVPSSARFPFSCAKDHALALWFGSSQNNPKQECLMPTVRDPLDPKTSMWYFLAFYLRFLRERAGLSLTQCGSVIGIARSTVSNMEAGRQRPHDDWMVKLDKKYDTGQLLQVLLWFARMAHDPDWGRQLLKYEEEAISTKSFHAQVVPLALQTEDYTRACVRASKFKDLDGTMARRTARKTAYLDRGDAVLTWAVIDEAVLARLVGGPR